MNDVSVNVTGNGIGRIVLNRPDALHALNEPMCAAILAALSRWRDDPDVRLVLVDHAEGTRGFCAGGDIRMLATSGAADGVEARAFFATEYRMNTAIHEFPKPYIAMLDGVTMGGGVGLSVHGSHRIATERTLFAMPETGIGLFPDVGGGWFLPRLEGELGTWLALTGARLKGADVAAAGIATHFLPSELCPNLKAQLLSADFSAGTEALVDEILRGLTHAVPVGSYVEHVDTIDACFRFVRAEDIVAALLDEGGDWAHEQAGIIATKSPRTVKVALRQLREGASMSDFRDNMRNEFRIGARQVQSADFIEGVRAVILDKDHEPKWSPATLEGVSDDVIDSVFALLGEGKELTF